MNNYDNGIPLGDSDWVLASRSLIRKYRQLPFLDAPPAEALDQVPPDKQQREPILERVFSFVDAVMRPQEKRSELRRQMREALIKSLRAGKYVAIGFRVPRNPSNPPIYIPPDLYEPKYLDWHNSSIKGAGLEFASVRIVRVNVVTMNYEHRSNSQVQPVSSEQYKIATQRRSRGRPSAENIISEAFADLAAKQEIDFAAPLTVAAARIQLSIRAKYGDQKVPRYEAIRRRIRHNFPLCSSGRRVAARQSR